MTEWTGVMIKYEAMRGVAQEAGEDERWSWRFLLSLTKCRQLQVVTQSVYVARPPDESKAYTKTPTSNLIRPRAHGFPAEEEIVSFHEQSTAASSSVEAALDIACPNCLLAKIPLSP